MDINLSGKTALVTGGSVGIGRAIALALARCGADVAINFFKNDQAKTSDEIRAMGRQAPAFIWTPPTAPRSTRRLPRPPRNWAGT